MVFVEGDDYRQLRRPGDDPAQFRSPVRFGAVLSSAVPSSAVVDGLVAWYRFADNSNTAIDYTAELDDDRFADTTAFDGTVNGASFVENGGVRDVLTGANSGAYDFDGTDDFISGPDSLAALVQSSGSFTIMCWANVDSTANEQLAMNFNSARFSIGYKPFGPTGYGFRGDDGASIVRIDSGDTTTNQYRHLTATFDGSQVKFYLNSSLEGSKPFDGFVADDEEFTISSQGGGFRSFFDGTIDDVRLYNRALSASEINQIYQNTDPDQ
jgi:hypothetical protein